MDINYTQQQKDLLLDKLFDGVVCLNIYGDIDIIHKSNNLSYYNPKYNVFRLNYDNIWQFLREKNGYNHQEIRYLTEGILRDLTKRKELTTKFTFV